MIPSWLKKYLSEDSLPRIRQAIHQAEQHTSAEIVPMICRSSTSMMHVLPILWSAALIFWGALFFSFATSFNLPLWGWIAVFLLTSLTAALLHRIPAVQRACTNSEVMLSSVEKRAELEFYRAELNHTRDRTGVLIFASLIEKRAVILADKTIAQRLPAETWNQAIDVLLAEIKSGNMERGYVRCIEFCAQHLQAHFPIKPHDEDELHNDLIILAD